MRRGGPVLPVTRGYKITAGERPGQAMSMTDFQAASVTAGLSALLVGISVMGLFNNQDARLVLTYQERFAGLKQVREAFYARSNYTVLHNPFGVAHVPFSVQPETLEELEDLERRFRISVPVKPNATAAAVHDPSLLREVLLLAWCTTGPPVPGVLPADRAPGCRCIADVYLDFINKTLPAGASNFTPQNSTTNLTVIPVAQEVRRRYGDEVYKCWDKRQVVRTRTCGRMCTTHVAGLALFANIVLLLTSLAYLLFYRLSWNKYMTKFLVALLGVALSIPYLVRDAEANSLNVAGIIVCVFYLTISLHEELGWRGMEDTIRDNGDFVPSPLAVCVLVNLPLVFSAHTIQLGVSGYGRDLWAVISFGFCGGLLGLLLQRYFWQCCWQFNTDDSSILAWIARKSLAAAYVCAEILLLLLVVAYYFDTTPYAGGTFYVFVAYGVFLTAIFWVLSRDDSQRWESRRTVGEPDNLSMTFMQGSLLFLTLLANIGMTVVAVVDARPNA
jgi:hypothetical protein